MTKLRIAHKGRFLRLICIILVILVALNYKGILRSIFPVSYDKLVDKYSQEYMVDFNLVMGVIKAESNFDEKAVSNKGAKGLMQLTDDTAKWVAKKMGDDKFKNSKIFEPETNIKIGCYYIKYLLDRYGGDEKTALAAYNAGPGRVDKWLKDERYSINKKTLDAIPYKETSEYVDKVFTYKKFYQNIYKGERTDG